MTGESASEFVLPDSISRELKDWLKAMAYDKLQQLKDVHAFRIESGAIKSDLLAMAESIREVQRSATLNGANFSHTFSMELNMLRMAIESIEPPRDISNQ